MITMINTLCAYYDIKEGAIVLGCDGIQALRHVDQSCDITNPRMPQFDLLSATRNALRICPVQVKMKHVKGHQDDDWEAVLDRWATLNVAADDGAKEHWYRTVNMGHQQHRIFDKTWAITIGGTKICTRLDKTIREARHAGKILKYWEEKGRFGNGNKADIDWETAGSAMKTVTRTRRQWVTKHVSGFCATGKMMRQWGKRTSAKCPRCDCNEDAQHVWKCRGSGTDEIWTTAMGKFKDELVKLHTHPNLGEVLCDRLTAWRHDLEPTVEVSHFLGLRTTIENQERVGWQAMLEGMPVQGWEEVQQRYFVWRKKRQTGKRWLVAIIKKLWDVAWDLWEHRNGILHDSDTNVAEQQLNFEVTVEYNMGPQTVTREARQLFRPGLNKLLLLLPAAKRAWLIRVRNSRIQFAELATTRQSFSAERSGMAHWLQPQGIVHR